MPTASSVSEYSSFANFATASSNVPARAGRAKAAIGKTERASVRRRSTTLVSTGQPRQRWGEGGDNRRLLRFCVRRGSGTLTAALVGLGVVVAAILANPVADQVPGALALLRPCIAGHQTRGLPHHVELAVGFDFANEHRLGDVMVRQHLRSAAAQVLCFGAGQRGD